MQGHIAPGWVVGLTALAAIGGAAVALVVTALGPLDLDPRDPERPLSVGEIYRQAAPGVVRVTAGGPRAGSGGSGFVLDGDGHVVTNAHVIQGADRVEVFTPGGEPVRARVVGTDPSVDLALLAVPPDTEGLRPLAHGGDARVRVGDPVVAIGAPFGLDRSATVGIVSGLARQIPAANDVTIAGAIQTDAALNPGNSGGPLLDASGQVIGVTTRIATRTGSDDGVGFAVPIATVVRAAGDLLGRGGERPYVGFVAVDVDRRIAADEGLPAGSRGILVVRVFEEGPGRAAGLAVGDVLVGVDGRRIHDNPEFTAAIRRRRTGERASLSLIRDARELTVDVTLARRPGLADDRDPPTTAARRTPG